MKYLIEPFLPEAQVSVLAGSSGVGKTTLLAQLMQEIKCPFVYVTCDRSIESYDELFTRTGLKPFPILSIIDRAKEAWSKTKVRPTEPLTSWVEEYVRACKPAPKLIVYDTGLYALKGIKSFNDQKDVWLGMFNMSVWCAYYEIAVILVFHTNKTKKDSDFMNIFNRISGSHGLLGYACTKALIVGESEHKDGPALILQGQNFADQLFLLRRTLTGLFEVREHATAPVEDNPVLSLFPPYAFTIRIGDLVTVAKETFSLSRASVFRHVMKLEATNLIERVDEGVYRRTAELAPPIEKR